MLVGGGITGTPLVMMARHMIFRIYDADCDTLKTVKYL